MDKIRELMVKCSVKPELADQICEAIEAHTTSVREQLESDFTAKKDEAKRLCVEETEAHKKELARRLSIWCEAKSAAVDATLTKQSAIKESEAVTKLREMRALFEGVELNGAPNGKLKAEIDALKSKLQTVLEEKNKATEIANRQTQLAKKLLENNRALERQVVESKKVAAKTVTESAGAKPATQRIDGSRRTGATATSRPTIVENQTRKPAAKPASNTNANPYSVEGIANSLE